MKKYFLLFTIGFICLQSCRSVKNMPAFYAKYEDKGIVISIPKFVIQFASKQSDNGNFLKHLLSTKVFIIKNNSPEKQKTILKDLRHSIKGENFEDLISIKNDYNSIQVSVLEENGKVKQMILGISGSDNVMVLDSQVDVSRSELERALQNISDNDVDAIRSLLTD